MEPGHEDREDRTPRPHQTRRSRCRNGARSRRPGRPALGPGDPPPLAGRNGARSRRPGRRRRDRRADVHARAAMEPGHEDREDVARYSVIDYANAPQWSPVTKTGKTAAVNAVAGGISGRNGARSRRPGRPGALRRFESDLLAAMEPGHEDREDRSSSAVSLTPTRPQWSPVTKTGKTRRPTLPGRR